jgi:hypothetical protein
MICLPPDLEPLSLLRNYCHGALEEGAKRLLDQCDEMCRRDRWGHAEAVAQDAENRGIDYGDWHGCAVALLKLAEACREADKLTMAHRYGERALSTCRQRLADESKMTAAIAAYSLGIINHLREARHGADRCYEDGHRRFREIEEDCLRANRREQAGHCDHAARLITELWRHSGKQRFETHGERSTILTGFCTSSDGAIEYRIVELETVGIPSEWQASIDGEPYELVPLPGKSLDTLNPAETYLAPSATQTAHPHLGTQDGDYILVHPSEELDSSDPDRYSLGFFLYFGKGRMDYVPYAPLSKPKGTDVDWGPEDFLKFERGPDGRFVFVPVEPPPMRIIGLSYGYPIAILRSGA